MVTLPLRYPSISSERLAAQGAILTKDFSDFGTCPFDALNVNLHLEKPGYELEDSLVLVIPLAGDGIEWSFALVTAKVLIALVPDEQFKS